MLRLIKKYLKGYYFTSGLGLFLKLLEAAFDLIVPIVVASIIDKGIGGGDTGYVIRMSGILVGLCFFGFGFSATCQFCAAKSAVGFGSNLREKIFSHINELSCSDLDKLGIPSLVNKITADVNNAQQSVNMFIRLATRAPFMLIGSLVAAFLINPSISLIFLGAEIFIALVLYLSMTRTFPYFKRANKKLDTISLLTSENVSGVRVVRAFSTQSEEVEDFTVESDKLASTVKKASFLSALMTPLSYGAVNLATILILYFGGISVNAGTLSQGETIALINYLTHVFYSITILATIIVIFTKGVASAKRINAVLEVEPSMAFGNITSSAAVEPDSCESDRSVEIDSDTPAVELNDISFSYGTNVNPSLEGVSFSLRRGETLGIIGRTGSGKSSVINLIQRFYDTEAGSVKLFGVPIREYGRDYLRSLVSAVPQTAVLFSGTLRENMLWGDPDATDEQIWAALKIAQADGFVSKIADGLDAKVIKGGKNFSGGQRQRLTVARALLKNAPILVLDDSSSALDFATDAALRRAIKRTQNDKAVIIISQRATSIMNADKILVLEHGKQAGLGTHKQLLKDCEIYKEIYHSQTMEGNDA